MFIRTASGSRHGLSYIRETEPGVTPVNPEMLSLTHTSCSLNITRDTLQSAALRSDRMIPFARTGTDKIGGSLDFEFEFGEYDALLEGALGGSWTENVLKAGCEEHSFTFERAFTNINQYGQFRGCYINQISLSIKPNAMVTGSFEIVGLNAEYKTIPLKPNPDTARINNPYDSYTGVLKEGGTEIAIVTGIDLTLANGLEPQYGVFARGARLVSWGRSTLTGTLTAFFTDQVLLGKFLNDTPASLEFTLGNGKDKSYIFTIPNIVYTGADNAAQNEGPIQLSMPFTAVLGRDLSTNFQITRIVAPVTPPSPSPEPTDPDTSEDPLSPDPTPVELQASDPSYGE